MKVTIREVAGRKELRRFVDFPNRMYRNNPYYVTQLVKADMDALNPKTNHAFEVCEVCAWMAFDENGQAVGRIAGIINRSFNEKNNLKRARFSYVDFIDDKDVVDALLDTVEDWARKKGMTELCGPEGMLEFDVAGVLVQGFDKLPTAYGKYNFPYYESHFIRRGYVKETDWIESVITIPEDLPEQFYSASEIIPQRLGIRLVNFHSKKELMPYVPAVFDLMNRSYSKLYGFSELTQGQKDDLAKQFIPNVNVNLVKVVLDSNDNVIAFCIWMPSLSRALQKCHGRLFPFGFIHILRALRHNDRLDTLLVGIDEEYRNKGLTAIMFAKMWPVLQKLGVRYMETTRELENNISVQNLMLKFDYETCKRARCYKQVL
ncbi:MAG: N-acetyltransferase [Bacteroidaceae bacterium]|nr:N-acetyltransferase [Bacteroidaceae bacterium]